MAELRDRYRAHGFDDEGNDNSMKTFEKATKHLVEFSKVFPKELKNQQDKSTEDLKGAIKEMGVTVGNSIQDSLGKGAATMVQAIVGGAGPLGYVLEKTLNLSGATENLINSFGKNRRLKNKSVVSEGGSSTTVAKERKESKDTFESYPTINKLRAYLDYKAKTNSKYDKFQKELLNRGKEQAKFEKDQRREQANFKKIFKSMQKGIDKQALINMAIAAGVVLGVGALIGLGVWIKALYDDRFGDKSKSPKNMKNQLPRNFTKEQKTGEYSAAWQQTSAFSPTNRTIKFADGTVKSAPHEGMDISAKLGDPIPSIVDGKAYAKVQYANKQGYFTYDPNSTTQTAGYGIFVDIVCSEDYATRLGYPGKRVVVRYAHLAAPGFKTATKDVKAGEIIGYAGSSGDSTGVHIHFQILVNGIVVKPNDLNMMHSKSDPGMVSINPYTMKNFLGARGETTTAYGALLSFASRGVKSNELTTAPRIPGRGVGYTPLPTTPETIRVNTTENNGNLTGGAASLTFVGKNDTLMGANNISNRANKITQNQQSGYVGTLPTLGNTIQSSAEEPKFQLSFDIDNSATKVLKQAEKPIDFIKV